MNNLTWFILILSAIKIFADDSLSTAETVVVPEVHTFRIASSKYRSDSSEVDSESNNDSNDDNEDDNMNWHTLAENLDFYNTKTLVKNWKENEYPVNPQCAKDITRFVKGLRNQEPWALKADDASGRFTNGFFWGNSYFIGSATECTYIGYNYTKANDKFATSGSHSSEPKKKNVGFSGSQLFSNSLPDHPPYKLGFFTLTILVNNTIITPVSRSIQLGVCLPFSCTAEDIFIIARLAANEDAKKHFAIEKVRDQHNQYDIYSDNVFWTLVGSSVIVIILMIIGTILDYYITFTATRQQETTIYDLEKHVQLRHSIKLHQELSNDGLDSATTTSTNSCSSNDNNNNNDIDDEEETVERKNKMKNHNPLNNTPSSVSSANDEELSVIKELLLSFSVRENMKTICDSSVGRDTISTIHGLRAISMAWVILGHTCIVIFKYSDNMEYRKVVEKNFLFQTITSGAFSVDTFFFMGGLLVAYLFFRTNAMGDLNKLTQGTHGFVAGLLKFIGLLLYRFSRLTTPYMFILGVVQVTMKWFHANSVFEPPTNDHENCPNYWWRNLLYINTLFPVDQMCMLWSWYVADDTQFYVIGAVILVIATNHIKVATVFVVALLVSSWLTTGYIALINNHMPSIDDPLALFDKIYDKPWTRMGPYLIGMSVGYILFKTDCKIKMSKATVVVGWLLSIACLLSLIYGLYEAELTPVTAAAYSSLSHSAWALGLSWIIIACSTGYGGWVNEILSAPILYPFSRVTYCAYLVHPIIIRVSAMHLDLPFHLGKDTVVIVFIGQLILSYLISFVVSLCFEAPVVSMLKILSPKKKKRIF
ncbi:Similar to nrf-6: Nose resistant to fluoxetine protein 6 (Caenorhabditis elegans) [Cotesia congregata]|uniref:Similar to nrf-6: Nose resistant to fluoxetine protein 6 (Caenorhabditis elegans) n=1 Tax=Cotesia congregata TaxID=51543 RepID=A0A8J2MMJ3_COTCN|nr:Similar to nrf-6: Nose resistant to fluoxetine protein 6 (Caenorhabditis elegans) [Cotesia congregata]